MWWNGRVYFVSDRDGTMNLWSMDEDGGDLRQHTRTTGWDVRVPSLVGGPHRLPGRRRPPPLRHRRGPRAPGARHAGLGPRPAPREVGEEADGVPDLRAPAPEGRVGRADRARPRVRGARRAGPTGAGLAQPGVRYRDVVFMPDGKSLLALSDASGELEFVTLPGERRGRRDAAHQRRQAAALRGGSLARRQVDRLHRQQQRGLGCSNVATKAQTVTVTNREGVADFAWAPDSRWLAFSQAAANTLRADPALRRRDAETHVAADERPGQQP